MAALLADLRNPGRPALAHVADEDRREPDPRRPGGEDELKSRVHARARSGRQAALATVEAERATIDELRERCNGWTHLTVEEASAAAADAAALRERLEGAADTLGKAFVEEQWLTVEIKLCCLFAKTMANLGDYLARFTTVLESATPDARRVEGLLGSCQRACVDAAESISGHRRSAAGEPPRRWPPAR